MIDWPTAFALLEQRLVERFVATWWVDWHPQLAIRYARTKTVVRVRRDLPKLPVRKGA